MIKGPVEYVVISFEGNHFKGEIIPALKDVVDKGIIRIIDLVFIRKDEDDSITMIELENLEDIVGDQFDPLVEMVSGLVGDEDVALFAQALEPNSSAAVILFEHLWAIELRETVVRANGKLVANGHIPLAAIMELLDAYGQSELE